MGNALIFTGLVLLSGLAGGLIGSCCAKSRTAPEVDGRLADLEDRLDALATHCMDEAKRLRTDVSDVDIRADELHDHYMDLKQQIKEQSDRIAECELLIGETPEDGLLGRVGALEETKLKEERDGR